MVATPSPSSSSHFNPHRTVSPGPDLSRAFGNEDEDFYMENTTTTTTTTTTNGQLKYYGLPMVGSDASFTSFYCYNSPVQLPVLKHPAKISTSLVHPTGPSAFYAGPVRGAGYYSNSRTDTR